MKMKVETKNLKLLKSNQGLISIDFLFGFLLSFAFLMIFFALAYSLTAVEVVQYIAFASSRSYMGADTSQAVQANNATSKATSLITKKFAVQLNKNYFEIGTKRGLITIRNDNSISYTKSGAAAEPEYFIGVQIPLTIHLLDFHIPFFGSTKATDAGSGFKTTVSSYLIREPSEKECRDFNDNRGAMLRALPPYSALTQDFTANIARVTDNGC